MTRRTLISLPPFFWVAGEGAAPPFKPDDVLGHDEQTHLVIVNGEVNTEQVAFVHHRLRDVDAGAMADPDNWWSLILEQLAHDLL